MRLCGGARRTAFNRLAGGLTRAARGKPATPSAGGTAAPTERVETTTDRSAALRRELKQGLQTAFGLNSRYADDAILKANEVIASQRKLIPTQIAETEAKRERTERKRKASQRKAERLRGAGREVEAAAVEQAMRGQGLRLTKLGGGAGPGRFWQRTRAVRGLSGPGGSPGVRGAVAPRSPSPPVAYVP